MGAPLSPALSKVWAGPVLKATGWGIRQPCCHRYFQAPDHVAPSMGWGCPAPPASLRTKVHHFLGVLHCEAVTSFLFLPIGLLPLFPPEKLGLPPITLFLSLSSILPSLCVKTSDSAEFISVYLLSIFWSGLCLVLAATLRQRHHSYYFKLVAKAETGSRKQLFLAASGDLPLGPRELQPDHGQGDWRCGESCSWSDTVENIQENC